jgi:hypothetical protein
MMLGAISASLVAVLLIIGPNLVSVLFGLHVEAISLVLYAAANAVVAWMYLESGQRAAAGRHGWWPIGASLVIWGITVDAFRPSIVETSAAFAVAAIAGSFCVRQMAAKSDPRVKRNVATV